MFTKYDLWPIQKKKKNLWLPCNWALDAGGGLLRLTDPVGVAPAACTVNVHSWPCWLSCRVGWDLLSAPCVAESLS